MYEYSVYNTDVTLVQKNRQTDTHKQFTSGFPKRNSNPLGLNVSKSFTLSCAPQGENFEVSPSGICDTLRNRLYLLIDRGKFGPWIPVKVKYAEMLTRSVSCFEIWRHLIKYTVHWLSGKDMIEQCLLFESSILLSSVSRCFITARFSDLFVHFNDYLRIRSIRVRSIINHTLTSVSFGIFTVPISVLLTAIKNSEEWCLLGCYAVLLL
jgi:hypothetical protein